MISALKYGGGLISNEDIQPGTYIDKLFYDLKFTKLTQTTKVNPRTHSASRKFLLAIKLTNC